RSSRRPRRAPRAGRCRAASRHVPSGNSCARAAAATSPCRCRGQRRTSPGRRTPRAAPGATSAVFRASNSPRPNIAVASLAPMRRLVVVAALLAGWAAPAYAGGPSLVVGAAEDSVQQTNVTGAKAKLDLLKLV